MRRNKIDEDRFTAIPPQGICKGCDFYENRFEDAKMMESFWGDPHLWDEKRCWEYCWKRGIDKRRRESHGVFDYIFNKLSLSSKP